MAQPAPAANSDLVLVLKRTFDAPRERVFDAWLDAKHMSKWMGPRGVNAEVALLEPRVGGRYRILMHTPDKSDPIVGGVFKEIVRPERLVYTWTWEHDKVETLITLTFAAVGKTTELTIRHEGFASMERRDGHNNGWIGSLEKLAEALAG
jgi:uncharacterized protein YndB with AHSA1/START domain